MDQHRTPDRAPASGAGRSPERADYRGGFRSTIDEADDRVKEERIERAAAVHEVRT